MSSWIMPEDLEGFSGSALCGYAHGAAGIGDVLIDLWKASGRKDFELAAAAAYRWLAHAAVHSADGMVVDWPTVPGGTDRSRLWCRGATGVGMFLVSARDLPELKADRGDIDATISKAFRAAARTLSLNATLCHGLAGSLEFMLDVDDRGIVGECGAHLARVFTAIEFLKSAHHRPPIYLGDSDEVTMNFMTGSPGTMLAVARYLDRSFAGAHVLNPFRGRSRRGCFDRGGETTA